MAQLGIGEGGARPGRLQERKDRGLRAGKACAEIDELAKIPEETGLKARENRGQPSRMLAKARNQVTILSGPTLDSYDNPVTILRADPESEMAMALARIARAVLYICLAIVEIAQSLTTI